MRQFFAGVGFELFTVCPGKSAVFCEPAFLCCFCHSHDSRYKNALQPVSNLLNYAVQLFPPFIRDRDYHYLVKETTTGNWNVYISNNGVQTGNITVAAEKAQNAETSATTVQMVSVWFSVVIGVLLTYAGSIGTLSVAAVLMYQAAWSALSIAVCALKQHN